MNQEMERSDNWLIFKKCWSETWASNLTGAQAENCTKGKADGCILPSLSFQLVVHISVRLLAKRMQQLNCTVTLMEFAIFWHGFTEFLKYLYSTEHLNG